MRKRMKHFFHSLFFLFITIGEIRIEFGVEDSVWIMKTAAKLER